VRAFVRAKRLVSDLHRIAQNLPFDDMSDLSPLHANDMGIVARVTDAGGYCEGRSIEALLRTRQEHHEMVAAVAGPIMDALSGLGGPR
jgi:hypothetical protein